jgi:hypothetical protein
VHGVPLLECVHTSCSCPRVRVYASKRTCSEPGITEATDTRAPARRKTSIVIIASISSLPSATGTRTVFCADLIASKRAAVRWGEMRGAKRCRGVELEATPRADGTETTRRTAQSMAAGEEEWSKGGRRKGLPPGFRVGERSQQGPQGASRGSRQRSTPNSTPIPSLHPVICHS